MRNQAYAAPLAKRYPVASTGMIAAVRVVLSLVNFAENLGRQLRPRSVWLLMIVAAAIYYPRFVKLPAGMETYPQAASCLWHGQMLQACDAGFTYPPFFALVMLPFAPMPLWLRDLAWYVVTLAATIGSFKLSESIARKALPAPLGHAELCWLRFFALLLSAKLILALNIDEAHSRSVFDTALAAADGSLIIVVGTLIALLPRRSRSAAIDGSLLLIAMLMLSPMTSRSHYVALLLPYMTLVALNLRDARSAALGRTVLAVSFALVTLAGNDAVGEAFTVWAYRHSAMVLGTLVLLIYFAALVLQRQVSLIGNLAARPLVPATTRTQRASESPFRSQSGFPPSRE
jgi:hypothetical protein